MTLKEMIDKRNAKLAAARALIDQIGDDTPEERSVELVAQHDAAMAEYDAIDADINRRQRLETAEANIEDAQRRAHDDSRAASRPAGTQGEAAGDPADPDQRGNYEDAFFGFMRAGGDVTMMDQELRGVLLAGHADFSDDARAQLTTPDTAGGFTVPTLLQNSLTVAMAQNGPMYDAAIINELLTDTGANMDYPTINDLAGRFDELPEGAEVVYDGGKAFVFGQNTIGAHMYDSKFIKLSRTLMQDSNQSMVQVVSDLLGERAGRTANERLTLGTGVDEPQGIMVGASLGHTSVAAGAIATDDLIDHQHSVNAIYRGRPGTRWQFNDDTLKVIRKFKDADGNYIWSAADIKKGVPATLLGNEYSINPDLPDIAPGADPIIFGDHKKYMVRKVGSIIIGVAREKFFPNLGLAAIMRFDGRVTDQRALKRLRIS